MEAYRIWASLNLRGNAAIKMAEFAKATSKASLNVAKLEKSLTPLAVKLAKIDLQMKSVLPKLSGLSTTFVRITTNSLDSSGAIGKFSQSTANAASRTTALTRSNVKLAESLSAVAANGNMAAASLVGVRGARGGSASGGGGRRGHHISHLREAGLGPIVGPGGLVRSAASAGGLGLGAAAGGAFMLYSGFEHQKEFQQKVQQLRGGGLSEAQLQEAQQIAMHPGKGISSTGMIGALNDAFMASRNWGEAKLLAPMLAKAQFAGNATFKNMTEQQQQALVKFAEMRAGSDMTKIAPAMDLGYRLMNASAGTLDPKQQAQFMKQAATVAYHLSDRGYAGLEPIMQEISGTRTGTAYQTGYQMMATGAGTLNNKKRVEDLMKLGIYKGGTKDKNGRFTSTSVDPALLTLYEQDPVAFTKKIISIYGKNGTTTTDDINRRFALDFPRTTSQMLSLIMKNMDKIDRQLNLFDKQPGIQTSFQQAFKIPSGTSERLSNAWSSMATAFGTISSPTVIWGMNFLSGTLERMAKVFTLFHEQTFTQMGQNTINNSQSLGTEYHLGQALSAPISNSRGGLFTNNLRITPEQRAAASVPGGQPIVVNVNVDGKKMATAVIPHMADQISSAGTVSNQSLHNFGMTQTPTAYNHVGAF